MSLSKQVRDTESPVRLFFREYLPRTRPIVRDCNANQLKGLETISSSVESRRPTTVNTALHYRLNYYFATPSFKDLNAWTKALLFYPDERSAWYKIPAELQEFFRSLTFFLRNVEPEGKWLVEEQERLLLKYCFVLALFEAYPRSSDSPLEVLRSYKRATVVDFLSLAEEYEIDDLYRLSRSFYSLFKVPILKKAKANAKFDGGVDVGGAAADLILDGCLIDVKVTGRPKLKNTMLYQLLGYALLDYSDLYEIREVGIYFARQEKLLKWSVDDLVSMMASGDTPALGDLREHFRAHLGRNRLEESRIAPGAEGQHASPASEAVDKVAVAGGRSAERAAFERALAYMEGATIAKQPRIPLRERARKLIRHLKASSLFGRFR